MKPDETALEAAKRNLERAEEYLRTMIEARKDAEYREQVARNLRNEADAAYTRAQVMAEAEKEQRK